MESTFTPVCWEVACGDGKRAGRPGRRVGTAGEAGAELDEPAMGDGWAVGLEGDVQEGQSLQFCHFGGYDG